MSDRVSSFFREFLHWWGSELKGLLPRSMREPHGARQPRIFLSVEGARLQVIRERAGCMEALGDFADDGAGREEALLALAEAAGSAPDAVAGLRFGAGSCFIRRVELPAAARKDFVRILELDLERAAPFKKEDILTAQHLDEETPPGAGKILAWQAVVKRKLSDPLIRRMEELGISPAFADCWNGDRSAALPINFLSAPGNGAAEARAMARPGVWAAVTAALAASALVILYVKYGSALARLNDDVARAKVEAQAVRQALASAEEAAARQAAVERLARSRISMALVLDRLTALIPDSAWVYDLRIDGQTVEFSGFAKSAAALIPVIEQSETFTAATLTAPVVLEASEDKERFSLRAQLRGALASPTVPGREEP